jgi:ADP-ribosylglycohydrolase
MIGAIIGDIVGSRFEFNNHRSTNFELFHPDCRFTDDTVCTMAVAEWILGAIDEWTNVRKFASHLQSWCKRYPLGDYGTMFRRWIDNPVPYNSYGNGAAMRISPVAYAFQNYDYSILVCDCLTKVSHDHPEGIKGAQAIVTAIYLAANGCSKESIKGLMESSYGYNLNFTCDQIRPSNQFNETCQVTVPQAIVAFIESSDFESAIRLAVSIGGDSDTIAAITGSIAEAYYGIPPEIEKKAMLYLPLEMKIIIKNFKNKFYNDNQRL